MSTNPSLAREELSDVRVLVIDDHADERDLFALLLEGRGATVTFACTWHEVAGAIERTAPDVVVAATPTLLGTAAFARLVRAALSGGRVRNPAMRALAVSPYARESDRRRVLALGFDDHLPKPCDLASFVAAVRGLASPGE